MDNLNTPDPSNNEKIKGKKEDENIECIRSSRDTLFSEKEFAQRRGAELADEFTKLEVQIATLLIAFSGISLSSLSGQTSSIKIIYALGVFLLILSLVLGLVHIKRKEKFWDDVMNLKYVVRKKWMKAAEGTITFENAKIYQEGAALEKETLIFSPKWTWIIQTVCLGIAFVLFFILFLVLLF